MEGPLGNVSYIGEGNFEIKRKGIAQGIVRAKKLGLLAGGVGLTTVFSVLNAIYKGKDQTITQCHFVYSSRTEADIILREELDAINADESAPHIKVTHTLTRV